MTHDAILLNKLVEWNRKLDEPLIKIGYELHVAEVAYELLVSVKVRELEEEIIRLENVEEKAIAIVRYMRATKPDGVMSVITELGLLYPPEEKKDD